MLANSCRTFVVAAVGLGLATGVAQARETFYRGRLIDADGSSSRFRFTITSCTTEGGATTCEGSFSRCRNDPCPATKGKSTITFAADGTITIVLEASGERLSCELDGQPSSERGTYVCQ